MGRLAVVALLLIPSLASADARKDIVDVRHGRTQSSQEFVGWTRAGDAVVRRFRCSEGGELSCDASLDVLELGGVGSSYPLWHSDGLYDVATPDNPKGPVSTEEAIQFIRAEEAALAKFPDLDPGSRAADPRGVFGKIAGEPTKVYLRESADASEAEQVRLHIAVSGPRGVSIDLETLTNEPFAVTDVNVLEARLSPGGEQVSIATWYSDTFMCWDSEDIELTIASRGTVRARLANAVGLRAYGDGEVDEAYSLFVAATADDPGYAWGWFNRAAVESRRGDLDRAGKSLRAAIDLDASKGSRACTDGDFDNLRGTESGARLMACR